MSMTLMTLTLWLAAAAGSVPADGAENPRPRRVTGGAVVPDPDGTVGINALLAALRADATEHAGADAARALKVGPVEEVLWSDGALGCPQPGQSYTQALVPGWRVRIEVGAAALVYHASRRGQWLRCPAGRSSDPVPGGVLR
jgi:hypothetical protein